MNAVLSAVGARLIRTLILKLVLIALVDVDGESVFRQDSVRPIKCAN